MFNILVTGSNGQLGSEIKELVLGSDGLPSVENSCEVVSFKHSLGEGKPSLPKENNFFFTDRETLDISNPHAIKEFVEKNNITTIINCAAYTAVDKAESDIENADKINHLAVKYLAQIAKEKNIKLIHISTDYVFDGKNHMPYKEDDQVNPNGVYGKTKLDGERAMQAINPANSLIIRTSWVYSSYGANFVKTMLRLGKEKESLGVIYDQVGTPTYARDLAKAILHILDCRAPLAVTETSSLRGTKQSNTETVTANEMKQSNTETVIANEMKQSNTETVIANEMKQSNNVQIYNYSNEGVLSWYDFAKEIMRMSKSTCQVNPIETKEYPTPAQRPHYSLLNKSKIKKEFNITIPYWKDSLDECLKRLGERR